MELLRVKIVEHFFVFFSDHVYEEANMKKTWSKKVSHQFHQTELQTKYVKVWTSDAVIYRVGLDTSWVMYRGGSKLKTLSTRYKIWPYIRHTMIP